MLLVRAAEQCARQAIALEPQRSSTYRLLAQVLLLQGKGRDAEIILEHAYHLNSTDSLVNAALGWLAWQRGDKAKSLLYFRQAARVELVLIHQASEWAKLPATQELALDLYRTAMLLAPREASAYYDYGDLLAAVGRGEESPAWYERARAYERTPSQFYQRRAGLWLRLGQPELATNDYQQVIRLDPDNPWQYYRLGDLLRDQGRLVEALDAYERGRERDEDTALFHMRKGMVYSQIGWTETAVMEMEQAVKLEPTNYQPHYQLGEILRLYSQDYDGAVLAYRQAMLLAPNEMWPYLGMGEVYRAQAKYDEAAKWFSRAQAVAAHQSEPLYFLGLNAFTRKDFAQAVAYLENAVAIRDDQAVYYRYLGEAYAALGQWDAAVRAYQRLLTLDPNAMYAQQRLAQWESEKR